MSVIPAPTVDTCEESNSLPAIASMVVDFPEPPGPRTDSRACSQGTPCPSLRIFTAISLAVAAAGVTDEVPAWLSEGKGMIDRKSKENKPNILCRNGRKKIALGRG